MFRGTICVGWNLDNEILMGCESWKAARGSGLGQASAPDGPLCGQVEGQGEDVSVGQPLCRARPPPSQGPLAAACLGPPAGEWLLMADPGLASWAYPGSEELRGTASSAHTQQGFT